MPSGISNFQRNRVLDFIFRGQAFPANPSTYMSLFVTAPTVSAAGTEVTYTGYARQLLGAGGAASSGTSIFWLNTAKVSFPTCTTSTQLIVAFGLHDALTAGNLLWWASLTTTIQLVDTSPGFKVVMPVDTLRLYLDYA